MQGWRVSMEDAHAAELDLRYLDLSKYMTPKAETSRAELPKEQVAFFAVYDGHGGKSLVVHRSEFELHKFLTPRG